MKRAIVLLTLLLSACSSRETVLVYSPHGPDILKDYEVLFEQAYPEIDLQWLDMGSQDVYNRISAERNRPACDIWWGGPSTMFMQAVEEDLLDAFEPTWAGAVKEGYKDPAHRWYGTHNTPLAIMFNTRTHTRETVPQSWGTENRIFFDRQEIGVVGELIRNGLGDRTGSGAKLDHGRSVVYCSLFDQQLCQSTRAWGERPNTGGASNKLP
ncbi:MAG: ABC transporter substrate-binding protein [Candidatus Hydrogenedentes bacterium]|nr:ABC transporter substrate-binding protein [Candidatus Hydrogenedentota bacterium]